MQRAMKRECVPERARYCDSIPSSALGAEDTAMCTGLARRDEEPYEHLSSPIGCLVNQI